MKIHLLLHYYTALWLKYLHRVTTLLLDAVFPRKKRWLGGSEAMHEGVLMSSRASMLQGRELCKSLSTLYMVCAGKIDDVGADRSLSPAFFLPYQHPVVKRALWNFKYRQAPDETALLASIMYDECVAELSDRVTYIPFRHPAVLIYAPSSMYTAGLKNVDHMQLLASAVGVFQNAADPLWIVLNDAVRDTGATLIPQHQLKRSERLASAAYRYDMSADATHYLQTHSVSRVLCIDDITTTGATLAALSHTVSKVLAGDAIQCKRCIVTCMALAH